MTQGLFLSVISPGFIYWYTLWGFPGGSVGKESGCQCRRCRRWGFDPQVGKIPWRRKWQPTPVFLPGKAHGWRSLAGYSPWGHKESDATEHTCMHACTLWGIWWGWGEDLSCCKQELAERMCVSHAETSRMFHCSFMWHTINISKYLNRSAF